jgi:hypothetical protein
MTKRRRFQGSVSLVVSVGVGILLLASAGGVAAFQNPIQLQTIIHPPISSSFDISYVDNILGEYFFADRTNNAVDVFDAKTDKFLGYAGHGQFVGVGPSGAAGPNGVTTDELGRLWAGDGNHSIKVLSAAPSNSIIKSIDVGGTKRADELADDPVDHVVLIASDRDMFLTFIDTNALTVAGHFYYADNTVGQPATVPGHATNGAGIEQPVYDPQTSLFYQAVPGSPGFIDVFNPKTMQLVNTYPATGCTGGPTGLALGLHQYLLGACGNGAIAVSAQNGHIQTIISGVGGADQIWYNPGDTSYYLGRTGNLSVVNADNFHVEQVLSGLGGHTVAAYSGNNHVFSPVSGVGVDVLFAPTELATVAKSCTPTPLAGAVLTCTVTIDLGADRGSLTLEDIISGGGTSANTSLKGPFTLDPGAGAVTLGPPSLVTDQNNRVVYDIALGSLKAGQHTVTYQWQLPNLGCYRSVTNDVNLDQAGVQGHLGVSTNSFQVRCP